jgi:hypothetical protein
MTQLLLRKRPSRRTAEEPELAWPLRSDPPRTEACQAILDTIEAVLTEKEESRWQTGS